MGKEMKRAVKPEDDLPPEWDPKNDAEPQVSSAHSTWLRHGSRFQQLPLPELSAQ